MKLPQREGHDALCRALRFTSGRTTAATAIALGLLAPDAAALAAPQTGRAHAVSPRFIDARAPVPPTPSRPLPGAATDLRDPRCRLVEAAPTLPARAAAAYVVCEAFGGVDRGEAIPMPEAAAPGAEDGLSFDPAPSLRRGPAR